MNLSFLETLQQDFPLIGMFLLGILAWCATGIDDLLIFREIYTLSQKQNKKLQPILGLAMAVSAMIITVLILIKLTGQVPNALKYIQLGAGLFVLWLGYKALKNKQQGDDIFFKKNPKNFLWMSFCGYILNCTDDISVNLSLSLNQSPLEIALFFLGVITGVALMVKFVLIWQALDHYPPFTGYHPIKLGKWLFICASVFLSTDKVRGLTLVLVATYLFYSAIF